MLTIFRVDQGNLYQALVESSRKALPPSTVWLDLQNPSREDELAVERLLGIEVPTREEMQEIETSSRLYVEGGALVMTMSVLNKATTDEPESTAITFILAGSRLVTIRYADPAPFAIFIQRISRQPLLASSGEQVFMGVLEQIADSLADILESAAMDLEGLSRNIFKATSSHNDTDYKDALRRIGHVGDLATKTKSSLLNLNRLLLFFAAQVDPKRKDAKGRIKTLMRDAYSIDEHATFLSAKVNFLLDATLGMINLEQNNIIKIFSVAAVAFLPPTLIASIYGMNFKFLPELGWDLGYPFALFLMLLSAILPFWYFRKKKWL